MYRVFWVDNSNGDPVCYSWVTKSTNTITQGHVCSGHWSSPPPPPFHALTSAAGEPHNEVLHATADGWHFKRRLIAQHGGWRSCEWGVFKVWISRVRLTRKGSDLRGHGVVTPFWPPGWPCQLYPARADREWRELGLNLTRKPQSLITNDGNS